MQNLNNVCSNTECNNCLLSNGIIFCCKICNAKCCSSKCNSRHRAIEHQNEKVNVVFKSKFIQKGQIIKEVIDDASYNLDNFQFERNPKTNKVIVLGVGSFGKVYLARHVKQNKLYAIKHCNKANVISSGQSLNIIHREIAAHKSIIHPNVVRMYNAQENKESFYMILEYMPSGTLFSLIRKHKGISEVNAFKYFIQVVSAIVFLHENGYAHRDLKPENLLLDEEDNLKLCDFGWCVDVTSGERGTFCGTYEYMAPEIVKEQPYKLSIDVWSLGILLYELIHGYSPFRATKVKGEDNYEEVFKNILNHNYSIDKNISNDCEDLIDKLLTKNYKERMKVEDICNHPWIMRMEQEYIKSTNSSSNNAYSSNSNEQLKLKMNENKEHVSKSKELLPLQQDDAFELAVNNVKQKKRKVMKSNTNKKLNTSLNKEKLLSKEVKSFNEKESNDFCLFSDSKETSSKEDIKISSQQSNNNNNNSYHIPSLSKSEIHYSSSNNNNRREKLFIEQETPTPQYVHSNRNNNNSNNSNERPKPKDPVQDILNVFERASSIKKESQPAIIHAPKEVGFWERFFAPFRCSDNTNQNN